MRTRHGVLLACLLGSWSVLAADPSPAAAFAAGQQTATAGLAPAAGAISDAKAAALLKDYGKPTAEAAYYGATPNLPTETAARLAACSTTAPDEPYCQAVSFSQSNPMTRPRIAILPTDTMIRNSDAVAKDPSALVGAISGAYSACKTETSLTPPIFEERRCQQVKTLEELTCQKLRNVQVSWRNSCTPGTWFGNFWVNTWGNGEVGYRYAGIAINAYCQMGDTQRLALRAICTEEPCSGYAEIQVDAASGAVSPRTFTSFIGRSWYATDLFNRVDYKGGGCTADQCSFAFCTRYEDTTTTCDGDTGACTTTPINQTRACGTFHFERPRTSATVTDTWDNQCAAFEARLP